MLKGIFQFIKSKTFFLHLIIYIISLTLLIWLVISSLGSYTGHGETIKVPDFKGLKVLELDKFTADKNLRYLIIDSIYDAKAPKGSVIKQEPEFNAEVKEGRIIYLYITTKLPPSIQMPKLVDRSLRQAVAMVSTYGLKLGKIEFVPDQCANCVLDQLVKGKKIEPGSPIPKGTIINLIVGKGLSDEEVGVPCLYGLTRKEALEKLVEASLSIGAIAFDEPKDSLLSRVYKQSPSCGRQASINLGGSIDLFLTADKNKIIQRSDTTANNKKVDDEDFDN
ncbi:MAG: PASTA domain-containing protein [Bacteroidota bacterium]